MTVRLSGYLDAWLSEGWDGSVRQCAATGKDLLLHTTKDAAEYGHCSLDWDRIIARDMEELDMVAPLVKQNLPIY